MSPYTLLHSHRIAFKKKEKIMITAKSRRQILNVVTEY